MKDERHSDLNSPLTDYLIREEKAHGRKSREIFRAQDLRDSLVRESTETMDLKSKDDKGKEAVKGRAKIRYEANKLFSISEISAFDGRFCGDSLYAPGREHVWSWGDFPPQQWPSKSLVGSLVERLKTKTRRAPTSEERSELQAMVERAVADYLASDKTQRLIAEIDKAEARVDEEWAKEQAMYTAKFDSGGNPRPGD